MFLFLFLKNVREAINLTLSCGSNDRVHKKKPIQPSSPIQRPILFVVFIDNERKEKKRMAWKFQSAHHGSFGMIDD